MPFLSLILPCASLKGMGISRTCFCRNNQFLKVLLMPGMNSFVVINYIYSLLVLFSKPSIFNCMMDEFNPHSD